MSLLPPPCVKVMNGVCYAFDVLLIEHISVMHWCFTCVWTVSFVLFLIVLKLKVLCATLERSAK